MTARTPKTDLALAAIREGANTSVDVALDLGISVDRAGTMLWKLWRQGRVQRADRLVPSSNGRGGAPRVVWTLE